FKITLNRKINVMHHDTELILMELPPDAERTFTPSLSFLPKSSPSSCIAVSTPDPCHSQLPCSVPAAYLSRRLRLLPCRTLACLKSCFASSLVDRCLVIPDSFVGR